MGRTRLHLRVARTAGGGEGSGGGHGDGGGEVSLAVSSEWEEAVRPIWVENPRSAMSPALQVPLFRFIGGLMADRGSLQAAPPFCVNSRTVNRWMPDEATSYCLHCSAEFGGTVRRHHCRLCGLIYCWGCAPPRLLPGAEVAHEGGTIAGELHGGGVRRRHAGIPIGFLFK